VEHLLLNSNLLTDKGLAYIFEVAIKHNLKIRSLHVADNQISSKSAEELTKMLAGAPHEMTVDLSLNKLISRKGIATILSADVPMEFKEFYFIKKDRLQSTESSEYQAAAAPESAAGDEPGTETTE
jgi:hypothetical protein